MNQQNKEMKIQLDTIAKVIRISESVNLGEFFKILNSLFPNEEWKEYRMEAVIENWYNPIIIEREVPIYPIYPSPFWKDPIITYTADNTGVYNLQINQ